MKSLFRKLRNPGLKVFLFAALLLAISFSSPALAQSPPEATPRGYLGERAVCTPQNFLQQGDVILLGDIPSAPYRVIVPVRGQEDLLPLVRQCVADSFQTRSRLGKYIQVGAFTRRSAARQLARHLHSLGLEAQTIYDR